AEDHHDLVLDLDSRVVVVAEVAGHDAVAREHHRGLDLAGSGEREGTEVGLHPALAARPPALHREPVALAERHPVDEGEGLEEGPAISGRTEADLLEPGGD